VFFLTAFVYPGVLALLCVGTGLLVDRLSGGFLPGPLLPAVGVAALIAASQLTTYAASLAPATPWVIAAVALAGFALGAGRVRRLALALRGRRWQLGLPVLAYGMALAPVLLAGRPTFSSYMALADSAVHMLGADYLIHHGQSYAHLDLHNSYGQFINNYYNTSYPSGSDTLFGGSAFLLGLPLIWAFQPFNAFILATAAGPAWLLARRIGLNGRWAAPAALSATVPALVYAYELFGSIKEITALSMILTLGALVVLHERWLHDRASRVIPFAVVAAAGVSALGVGFGVWGLAALAVLVAIVFVEVRAGRQSVARVLLLAGAGAVVALVCAWPTWIDLSGSLDVTQNIASTSNSGNLHTPLRSIQVFGVWLRGSYKQLPAGVDLGITYALVALTLGACVLGVVHLLRARVLALAGWMALMIAAWLAVRAYATTWVDAKSLMLTSPVVVLVAWGGLGAVRARTRAGSFRWLAPLVAVALAGGVLASDVAQYHVTNLAPTARYDEMASLNARFAGRGPTLFSDFDEYSMYQLRDLDVGGPDFVYPPAALAGLARGYGAPVELDRASPSSLSSYPLIVSRRDPSAIPPPSAYRLLWQGTYYQVWGRRPDAPAAIAHVVPSGSLARQCARIGRLAQLATSDRAALIAAPSPTLVRIPPAGATYPKGWGRQRQGLVMRRTGRLSATFSLPFGGRWNVWLQGQIMPTVRVSVDGRSLGSIGGQLGGNSLVPDTMTPLPAPLAAGPHRLSVARGGLSLAPGDGGSAVLDTIFLAPAAIPARQLVRVAPGGDWRTLCGHAYAWIELVSA
jgi:hypothetical protein